MSALDPRALNIARAMADEEFFKRDSSTSFDRAIQAAITAYLAASPKGQVEAVAWRFQRRDATGAIVVDLLSFDCPTPSPDTSGDGKLNVLPLYAALSPAPSGGEAEIDAVTVRRLLGHQGFLSTYSIQGQIDDAAVAVARQIIMLYAAPSQVEG